MVVEKSEAANDAFAASISISSCCLVSEIHYKTEAVILGERAPERFSVRGW
jgi:hypothetical protein